MWPYHPELLSRAVPRYTSYPTAAEFHDGIGAADYREALSRIGRDESVSLYVHIPFCREICSYCGCNTGRANRTQRLATYLDALESEIDFVADRLDGRGRVERIAFGGGSPNAIEAIAFVRLVDQLTTRFRITRPTFSVEIDPRSLDRDWISTIRTVGIQRVSLGVQTFSPAIQTAIGRIQPSEMIERAVDSLRGAGVSSINFDLMYGLPGQTIADLENTIERTLFLGADRIALFGYAHLPSIFARQRRIDATTLPDAEMRFAQAAAGHEAFLAAGFQAVGFDHFARSGDPLAGAAREGRLHRNFQGFTDDHSRQLIGFGASAISEFPDLLTQNEKAAGYYGMMVRADGCAARRGVARDADARRRGALIEKLLCSGRARPGPDLLQSAVPALAPFARAGLVRIERGWVTLTPDALPYARSIASCFDAYRNQTKGQFSHAV